MNNKAMAQGYYYQDNNYNNNYQSSYEDMKKYSTYPTKDKKFVCQTGQFEGFFVESVEFCDVNIKRGPAGPAGPPGQQGVEGPAG